MGTRHARIIASLESNGWNVRDGFRAVVEGSQVMFFQRMRRLPTPGKRAALRPPPPPGTVSESFPS